MDRISRGVFEVSLQSEMSLALKVFESFGIHQYEQRFLRSLADRPS